MTSEQPEPRIVARSIQSLEEWVGYEPRYESWVLAESRNLKNSIVHFIDLQGSEEAIRLVYKIKSTGGREWFAEIPALTNEAVRLLRASGLRASPVLAFDVDSLIVVTLFIPGEPLRPLGWSDRRLSEERKGVYFDIGRGASILESVAHPESDPSVEERLWSLFMRRLTDCQLDEALMSGLETAARQSFDAAIADPQPYVMVHTDFSFNNTVVDGAVPGFIDIDLARGIRGSSLGKMLHKLEFTNQLPSKAAVAAQRAVKEGFGGEPTGMVFLRINRILRMLGPTRSPLGAMSVRRVRAIRALREMAGMG